MTKTLEKYLLHNQIDGTSFNNDASRDYLIHKMTGGTCCSGQNVFKHTVQILNKNQKTILHGGRVSLPLQYFSGNNNSNSSMNQYTSQSSFTKTSTITPHLAKQALPRTQFGGKSSISSVDSWLKGIIHQNGGNKEDKHMQNQLMISYHKNLDTFIQNVKDLSGGGNKNITKSLINQALKNLN